jgi:very-short-patch-repair endonuclease
VQKAARQLRCDPTRAEVALWEALRTRRFCGVRFRRQHVIDRFVVDFYSSEHRLAIEVDGDIHDQQREHDELRTEYLAARGVRVVRFRNEEVLNDLASVLAAIREAFQPTSREHP